MEKNKLNKIIKGIKSKNYRLLTLEKIDERDLLEISDKLKEDDNFNVSILIDAYMTSIMNENCDWNIGSILQHFDYNDIISALNAVPVNSRAYLYDSIGFCWMLGECPYKNETVINFLYEVLNYGRNPESWWKAAFSLEKMTGKNAINNLKRSLKCSNLLSLDECLEDLDNKKNVIAVLLNSTNNDIKYKIYPTLKEKFNNPRSEKELLNVIWLFGRLRLFDDEIFSKILDILERTDSYEMKYYIFQSMIDDPKPIYLEKFEKYLDSDDPLIKKMAIAGLAEFGTGIEVSKLEKMLENETNYSVISSLSKAIYKIKNDYFTTSSKFVKKYMVNENGLIGDDSDKWYADASIYNLFSEAEDPENLCFNLIFNRILAEKINIVNPIDLATGTGKTAKYILNNINYQGTLYAVDFSQQMLDYFYRTINRQKYYVKDIELVHSKIEDFSLPNGQKSSLIMSSFGFPSKISDSERCRKELENVYDLLSDDGVFVTLGWDETFNDELNSMWYKYIPDDIKATSFEEWRKKREKSISSPRNCNLTWYKKNLQIPLLYDTLEEAINVMGHLFGRDAALEILKSKRNMWWMSMGITWDNKESIGKILSKKK